LAKHLPGFNYFLNMSGLGGKEKLYWQFQYSDFQPGLVFITGFK
jgi:hypothetical protein